MKIKIISILVLIAFIISCKKDQQSLTSNATTENNNKAYNLSLDQVKEWYGKNVTSAPIVNNLDATSITNADKGFSLVSLLFSWDKFESVKNKKGNYWLTYLSGQPTFQKVKQGYRKLAFIRDSAGNIQPRILEIIPDAIYMQRKQKATTADFTGRVFIYDNNYHLIGGEVYGNGKLMGAIKPKASGSPISQAGNPPLKQSSKLQPDEVSVVTDCEWYDNNYIDGEGVVTIYSELDCSTSIYGGSGSGDIGGDDYSGSTGDDGGGGTSAGSPAPPSNLPGEDGPAVDAKALMHCFGNIADANATMTVTVYVVEPWPGTSFNIGPNSVGHVAIGLTKSSGNTSITQVVGYYPNAIGLGKMHAPSKIDDNGGDLNYNVSISYNVSASQFSQIVNYITNPPTTYDVILFNCTDFVYQACDAGGIQLPNPWSEVGLSGIGGTTQAMTPAGLGNSIQNLNSAKNVNTSGGTTPNSNGPCN
jgi:hypothetical protein